MIFIHVVNPFGPRFEAVGTVFAHVDNGAFVHPFHMFLQAPASSKAGSAGVTKKSRAIVLTRHMSVQSAKSLENSSTVLA